MPADADDPEVVRQVLEGIQYRRIDSDWLLQAFFLTLEEHLAERPEVRSLVACHFRLETR